MRIANGADRRQVTVENEFNTNVLDLHGEGGGPNRRYYPAGDRLRYQSPESTFNVRVFRHESDGQGGLAEVEMEVFSGLTMDPGSGQYAVNVITQQSALIDAALAGGFTPSSVAFKGYALAGRTFADAEIFEPRSRCQWRCGRHGAFPDFRRWKSVRGCDRDGSADRRGRSDR